MERNFAEITPELAKLAEQSISSYRIDPELYTKYDVKRGLRDINGNVISDNYGVLADFYYPNENDLNFQTSVISSM